MPLYGGITLPGHPDLENVRKLDLLPVAAIRRMQRYGFAIDREYCHDLSSEFRAGMVELEKDIVSYIPKDKLHVFAESTEEDGEEEEGADGNEFNVASAEQIGKLLFDVLGVGTGKELKRTSGGKISTGKAQLRDLEREHPVVPLILAYRERAKLISTYTDALPKIARFHPRGSCCPVCELPHRADTWRLHSEIVQTRAVTGRLAGRRPNLMNIPQRTELGSKVRAAFIASPGCKLVSADFSQVELRMMAHLANCSSMLDVYRRNGDIHVETAMACFGIDDPKKLDKISHRIPSKCFHPDTEVLTKTGWKRIVELGIGEEVVQAIPHADREVELQWAVPTEVFTQTHPSGKLVHLKNENMDLRVTPDHRMLSWKNGKTPHVMLANAFASLPVTDQWCNAGMLGQTEAEYEKADELYLRLAVATQADGHVVKPPNGAGIKFAFTRPRKIQRLRALLRQLPEEDWSESRGVMNGKPSVAFYVKKNSGMVIKRWLDADKTFPWWWLRLPVEARAVVLDEVQHWDGSEIKGGRSYHVSSAIQKNADVLQAIASITNRKSRLMQDPKSGYWKTSVKDRNSTWGGNLSSTTYEYTDKVACLSVPSSFVLVRDKGVAVICGQTANFLLLYQGSPKALYAQLLMAMLILISEHKLDKVPDWLTVEWCEQFCERWYANKHEVRAYQDLQAYRVRRYGMTWDQTGRVRLGPEIRSYHSWIKAAGERQGGNMADQGTSSALMKLTCAEANEKLGQIWDGGYGDWCWPIMPIHDQLILEADERIAEDCQEMLTWVMDNVSVDKESGDNLLRVDIRSDGETLERWLKPEEHVWNPNTRQIEKIHKK